MGQCGQSHRTRTDSCGWAPTPVSFASTVSASSRGRDSAGNRCPACRYVRSTSRPPAHCGSDSASSGGLARIDNRAVTSFVASDVANSTGAVTSILEDQAEPSGRQRPPDCIGSLTTVGSGWAPLTGCPMKATVNAFVDRSGGLWVSTSDGLYHRKRSSAGHFEQVEPSVDPLRPLSLSQDPEGRIWTTDPLVGFRALGDGRSLRGSEAGRGYRLLHDRDGNLWVATIGQGLWRVTPHDQRSRTADGRTHDRPVGPLERRRSHGVRGSRRQHLGRHHRGCRSARPASRDTLIRVSGS